MADRTGLGIMRGAEKATSNILGIMKYKQEIDDQKERTKILNQSSKAQTALAELKLKDATSKAVRQEKFMDIISRMGRGAQGEGQPGEEGVETDAITGGGLDWSMSSSGGMTLRPKAGITPYQKLQAEREQTEMATQKTGAMGAINIIKDQILNKGTITSGKGKNAVEKPYIRGMAESYLAKKHPKVNINDPEVQSSIFSLENMSPEFRPSFGIKALVGKGRAKLSRETKEYLKAVTSQEDIDKLVGGRDLAEKEGIDVDAVLEYFGQRK